MGKIITVIRPSIWISITRSLPAVTRGLWTLVTCSSDRECMRAQSDSHPVPCWWELMRTDVPVARRQAVTIVFKQFITPFRRQSPKKVYNLLFNMTEVHSIREFCSCDNFKIQRVLGKRGWSWCEYSMGWNERPVIPDLGIPGMMPTRMESPHSQ